MQQPIASGNDAEDVACSYLQSNNFKIIERNFACKFGEIDIIAYNDLGTLCFIEVKYRKNSKFGNAAEFVTADKQRKIIKTAQTYIVKKKIVDHAMQFDVVAIENAPPEVSYIDNAFGADY